MPIDPWWALAAWAVDVDGTVSAHRTIATELATALYNAVDPLSKSKQLAPDELNALIMVPVAQTLSLVSYEQQKLPANTKPTDDNREIGVILDRNIWAYGWMYGTSSRTSYLGVGVVCIGILVALMQFILGLVDLRPHRSVTQILITALEHEPEDEFTAVNYSRTEAAKVRFVVKDQDAGAGELSFAICK